ncbi:MAG: archaeosortase/exosortase family protein [Hymenobacteraceae bacterium]|nr:archaeosortase/exosortase family protein [Hymenobacteraceae bacterium]
MNVLSQRLPRFLITSALLYVGWYLFYTRLLHGGAWGYSLDSLLCQHIAESAAGVLRFFGYQSVAKNTFLFLNNHHVVSVGWQCDGMAVMALFAGFIIAYPGPWRAKLWFVPAGILIIHGINILRVVALALNQVFSRDTTQFNHHYTFTIVVYGFIFWFWTIWVRRFASTPTTPSAGAGASDQVVSSPANA